MFFHMFECCQPHNLGKENSLLKCLGLGLYVFDFVHFFLGACAKMPSVGKTQVIQGLQGDNAMP